MPETVVMKFGGTSVADAERLKRAAQRIVEKREQGHDVVAVLSARGKETDRLISDAFEISPRPTRARWTCSSRRASASRARCAPWRSTTSGTERSP
jgi:aspartokinase